MKMTFAPHFVVTKNIFPEEVRKLPTILYYTGFQKCAFPKQTNNVIR